MEFSSILQTAALAVSLAAVLGIAAIASAKGLRGADPRPVLVTKDGRRNGRGNRAQPGDPVSPDFAIRDDDMRL